MLGMLTFRLCLLSKPVSPEKTFLPSRISDSRSGLQTYEKSMEYPPNCSRLTQQDLIIRELEEKRRSWAVENRLKAD